MAGGLLLHGFVPHPCRYRIQADHAVAIGLGLPETRNPDLQTRGRASSTGCSEKAAILASSWKESTWPRSTGRWWTTAACRPIALSALLLAALGVYGVVAQSVTQRTKEIGIRLALGASRSHLWLVIAKHGLTPVLAGLLVGVAASLAASRSIAALLFGVTTTDPATYAAVGGVLLIAASLACWLPARRAGRVAPLEALRQE